MLKFSVQNIEGDNAKILRLDSIDSKPPIALIEDGRLEFLTNVFDCPNIQAEALRFIANSLDT